MRKVKTGIVGCGVIGRVHLQCALGVDSLEVAALADADRSSAERAAKEFGIGTFYGDAYELIDDPEIEAVVLAVPTGPRLGMALRAIGQGKHVLVEKPTGMNAGDVEALRRAQAESPFRPTVACCSARFRLLESAKVIEEFIRSGALGELRVARYRSIKPAGARPDNPPNWRFNKRLNGGGLLANWGTYDLDYLIGVAGGRLRPTEVSANVWTVPAPFVSHVAAGSDAETHVAAFIKCEGGKTITLERGECVAAPAEDGWTFIGERGSLVFRMTPEERKSVAFLEADPERGVVEKEIWRGDESYDAIHEGIVRDFADAVTNEREPIGSLESALLVQKLIDAIYASSAEGRAIPIR